MTKHWESRKLHPIQRVERLLIERASGVLAVTLDLDFLFALRILAIGAAILLAFRKYTLTLLVHPVRSPGNRWAGNNHLDDAGSVLICPSHPSRSASNVPLIHSDMLWSLAFAALLNRSYSDLANLTGTILHFRSRCRLNQIAHTPEVSLNASGHRRAA
jgi:hypothetical protein